MKKKLDPSVVRPDPKEKIMNMARKGIFDRNPLLATPHTLTCETCGCKQKIIYLDHLKSGMFELGKAELVEVTYAAPTITGLTGEKERITPIIMKIRCQRCETEISCSPVSLEYLSFTAGKEQKMEHMYV